MTAFQKVIIVFCVMIGCLYLFTSRKLDMTIVYPDNCVFTIDELFSRSMQLEIKDFIDAAYKQQKNPSHLLPKIESHFPMIKSIIIEMQDPTSLHFLIQAYQPKFLLNNEYAICQHDTLFVKKIFSPEVLLRLENITFDGATTSQIIRRLHSFVTSLTDPILREFSIRWIDKHAIWLDQKTGQDLSLLVGYDIIPTSDDVKQCRKLRGQIIDKPCKDKRGKPCKHQVSWVCDLRFDQQIVIFSTNKGV